ncbi:MBL fold metallo-hydrolase [Corynebacterium sp. 35RC1]|nr:MBL fold metallo-hydrolase [Corynebacterium sp. 35RC1]
MALQLNITGFAAGPYQTNCYVVSAGAANAGANTLPKATVIDPGMHALGRVEQLLEEQGVELGQVLLTHGHIDHTRDAAALANKWRVPLWIHEEDAFMLAGGDGISEQAKVLFDAQELPQAQDLRLLNHGQEVAIAGHTFTVAHAPGHSPGSVLFVGQEVVFSGDVLFAGSIGRTDLPHSNPAAMHSSLVNVVLPLNDALQVLPGHGGATSIRAERRSNPFLNGLR